MSPGRTFATARFAVPIAATGLAIGLALQWVYDGRYRAIVAFDAAFVFEGRDGSPSGPKFQARSAVKKGERPSRCFRRWPRKFNNPKPKDFGERVLQM